MSYLILDDVRDAEACFAVTGNQLYLQNDWVIVRSYQEFVDYLIHNEMPKVISFDHDLSQDHYLEGAHSGFTEFNYDNVTEKTGYHAALWLVNECIDGKIPLPECYAHSMNPVGRKNIYMAIRDYYRFISITK